MGALEMGAQRCAEDRIERDHLGEVSIPAGSLWGVNTYRALENFTAGSEKLGEYPILVAALAAVKQAAAQTNADLKLLSPSVSSAIIGSCEEIRAGSHLDQFPIEMLQGGAGTSTNMNVNEVIANLALIRLGAQPGEYHVVGPNEHVNLGQSTNDVYPAALKLAVLEYGLALIRGIQHLQAAFGRKAVQFAGQVKVGRTQLQDAVLMTLGQEFGAYAESMREEVTSMTRALAGMREHHLGGTAIGTGVNADPRYGELVTRHLRDITGVDTSTAPDLIEATQDVGSFVTVSGALKRVAIKLSKCCNDLRLLSSGPRAGLNEVTLPPRQAGSSIMPGKVNPVIPELVNQIAFDVVGADTTITLAAEAGQLQLNAFEPVIGYSLLKGLARVERGCVILADRCIDGIEANSERLNLMVEASLAPATLLSRVIGYRAAAEIAQHALMTGSSVRDVALDRAVLSSAELDDVIGSAALNNSTGIR
ncbi:aspartate ammonia-lyase [Mycolicibacterium sp. HK-90]|uniref:aspartate ammonia-lyase n=2 Tax=Mycobacteriaceae TaxID=1762 RepID=UPI00265A10E2|nr:aspartate ammonia-lyase [Mycolicibacterium sp. HK-90]WKG04005.1 aspartate ammonia-lyase [Mycolicibacterium sp. HK-90]